MKKYIKYLIIVLLILITTGCVTNYKRSDIAKYVRNEIGIRNFSVSRTYQVFEDEDGYDDRYWTVYDKNNDLEFYVIDDYFYQSEMTSNHLETDYYDRYYVKYADKINKLSNVTYEKIEGYEHELAINLQCTYINKKELKDCYDTISNINYVFGGKANFPVYIKYIDSKNMNRTYFADYTCGLSSIDTYKDDLYYNYFYAGYILDDSNILSDMSTYEYSNLLTNKNNVPLVEKDSNESIVKEYNNMFCSTSCLISYNTLYDVLKDEGYNVIGDNHNYKVYYKNDVYEFSDSFEEYSFTKNGYAYYYKKNGIKVDAAYSHSWERVLLPRDVNEMFGLQLYCDWHKN